MQNKTTPFDSLTYDQVSAILQAKANGFKGVTKNNTIIKDYNKEFDLFMDLVDYVKEGAGCEIESFGRCTEDAVINELENIMKRFEEY